jgi:hypothetical protein
VILQLAALPLQLLNLLLHDVDTICAIIRAYASSREDQQAALLSSLQILQYLDTIRAD